MPTGTYSLQQMADFMRDWDGSTWTWAQGSTITFNTTGLTEAAATLARVAFQLWDEASGLSFQEVAEGGSITLDDTNSGAYGGPGGWYYLSDPTTLYATSGNINVQQNWSGESNPGFNSYTLQTFIHEIGHVLGMGHSGDYNGSASYATDALYQNDTWQFSVMSYFSQNNYDGGSWRVVSTPMMADYFFMNMVYGAETTTRTGNTTYGFNSNAGTYQGFDLYNFASYGTAPAMTIFDSGGEDTLDASGYSSSQQINLVAGTFSDIGGLNNNIGIAHNTQIENAIGGSGADVITGNTVANHLLGNGGADTLNGGSGDDTLEGGEGLDKISGQNGNDAILGGGGDDSINGGANNDRIQGGLGRDVLVGGAGSDVFVFEALIESASLTIRDTIKDFTQGADKIDVSALGFDAVVSAFTGTGGELRVTTGVATTVLVGDLDGDKIIDFRVAFSTAVALTGTDFIM